MNKKICIVLLIILFVLFGLTAISAKDNQTNVVSQSFENQNDYDTHSLYQKISDNMIKENVQENNHIKNVSTYENKKSIDRYATNNSKATDSIENDDYILDDVSYDIGYSSSTDNKKQATLIKVANLNNVQYGSSVKIVGRLLNNNNTAIKYVQVSVTVNNDIYKIKTDGAGYIKLNYTVNSYDTQKVTFKYAGNKLYQSSSNSTTFRAKQPTWIKMGYIGNVKYGSTVNMVGRILNHENKSVKYVPITININGKEYNVTSNGAGYFYLNHTVNSYDTQKVTFKYAGNKLYQSSSNSTTFKIKQPTWIKMASMSNVRYGYTVEVVGKLMFNGTDAVKYVPVNININNKSYQLNTDGAGYFRLNYTVNNYDVQKVTFTFNGDNYYLPSSNSTSFKIKLPTQIKLDYEKFVESGKKISVVGSLVTMNNNILRNAPVTIRVNSQEINVNTNSNGEFQYSYLTNVVGINNISVSYLGNNDYIGTSINSTFKAYNPVNVIIDTPQKARNASQIDLRIYVTYDYSVRKTINDGMVTVKINGQTVSSNVKYGKAIISYKLPNEIGTYPISVSYDGNTIMGFANKNLTLTSGSISSSESAILGNKDPEKEILSLTNGVPNPVYMTNHVWADENGVYNITSEEILRVMKLDSYCQQVYGFTPKYTFFKAVGSNVYYVISREKWNVIARALNAYHVNKGYSSVLPPATVTVNLSGKIRYYSVYYDAQEWINGHQYTCGPTAMSMISQALNCYSSERKLAGIYQTTSSAGTDEDKIIYYSPNVHMKLYDVKDNKESVTKALQEGKMIFWHIRGHYMCIIAYNSAQDKYLCLNPSGPSHNIAAVQWATWSQIMSTDRGLKENGFMSVTPCWNLNSDDKVHVQNYYTNMGGKYTPPSNMEYPNNGADNNYIYTV